MPVFIHVDEDMHLLPMSRYRQEFLNNCTWELYEQLQEIIAIDHPEIIDRVEWEQREDDWKKKISRNISRSQLGWSDDGGREEALAKKALAEKALAEEALAGGRIIPQRFRTNVSN